MGGVPFWGLNQDGVSCNEGPTFMDDPWDTFWINDFQLPGTCKISGNPGYFEIETIKGKNQKGGHSRGRGYKPQGFELMIEITTPDQWSAYQVLVDTFAPLANRPDNLPGILSPIAGLFVPVSTPGFTVYVRHPELQVLGVQKAILANIPLSAQSQCDGGRIFCWKFIQSVLPKATVTKTDGGVLPPEDNRKPAANGFPGMPSANPANMTLDGPPLTTQGGAQ